MTATARSAATRCPAPAPRARARALSATQKSGVRSASTWTPSAKIHRWTPHSRSLAGRLRFRRSPRRWARCVFTTGTNTTILHTMIFLCARAQTRAFLLLPATAPTRRWSRARLRRSRRTAAAACRPSSRGIWTRSAKNSRSCRNPSPSPSRWTSTRRVCRFCRA